MRFRYKMFRDDTEIVGRLRKCNQVKMRISRLNSCKLELFEEGEKDMEVIVLALQAFRQFNNFISSRVMYVRHEWLILPSCMCVVETGVAGAEFLKELIYSFPRVQLCHSQVFLG